MNRAIKISLKHATAKKLNKLSRLVRCVRRQTNRYIRHVWRFGGALDKATIDGVSHDHLTYRYVCSCLRVALETVSSTRKSAQAIGVRARIPIIHGCTKFSCLVARIEPGRGSFDYVLKVSSLNPGKVITIPFKSHRRLNYWLAKPGARILDGCIIGDGWAALSISIPDLPLKTEGDEIGVDLGYNKLLVDSEGNQYGLEIKDLCEKIRRKQPGSKAKKRARTERDHYINKTIKELPWGRIKLIAVEDLKGLKKGKKKNRSKNFRKRLAPWAYRQWLTRSTYTAQENRVCRAAVDPRNTSRTCPRCGWVAKENRRGEKFKCVRCNYSADADFVGALNIIGKTRGNSQVYIVPESTKPKESYALR